MSLVTVEEARPPATVEAKVRPMLVGFPPIQFKLATVGELPGIQVLPVEMVWV